jgi:hypothetical protein
MRGILEGGDTRPIYEKLQVPWIFDTVFGKVYLVATSIISIYFIGNLIYKLYVRLIP